MESGVLEIQEVDLDKKVSEIAEKAKNSPEVRRISEGININQAETILTFGHDTAVEISKFSDRILSTITNSHLEDSSKMLTQLTKIMSKFDKKDFEDPKKDVFSKIFNKFKKDIEKILNKYKTIDGEISKIYVEIKKYEDEIKKSNAVLEEMFGKNIEYYEELEKYIQGGHLVIDKVKNEILPAQEAKAATGTDMDRVELNNIHNALEMLEQRIHDLELAKMVAIQTAPQIKMIQKGNYNLQRKIGSAFVVTIPVFKTGIIQAITIKRQKIQADSMQALDNATNEMLLRNADNIASQSANLARLAGGTSIKIETLEKTFETIMKGIDETKQIEEENKKKREEGRLKLAELHKQIEGKKF